MIRKAEVAQCNGGERFSSLRLFLLRFFSLTSPVGFWRELLASTLARDSLFHSLALFGVSSDSNFVEVTLVFPFPRFCPSSIFSRSLVHPFCTFASVL